MRVLIFHGYLLRGTGSNIYNASLARALADLGHEVHLVCQERRTEGLGFVDGVRCTFHVPDIAGLLPLYVADEYEGFTALPFPELDDAQIERYVDLNVRAVAAVAEKVKPDVALANHLIMGPVILARALGARVPYAVKVHGSALEYVVRPHRERFLPWAREGLAGASAVLVGSRHTAESLWEVMDEPGLAARTRLGPPGVDVHAFRPRSVGEAEEGLARLAGSLEGAEAATWGGEAGAAEAVRALDPARDRIVGYVGKLIVSKGVDLLLAAWPLVVAEVPEARLCVVGFGTYRAGLEQIAEALANADLEALGEVAARGRELEGGPRSELRYVRAFLDELGAERREAYLAAAPHAAERVHFTGRLEHDALPALLPAFEAQVVPSTFPESFGMVAAEAAACGAVPVSAAHSGLAEVTSVLAPSLDESLRPLLSFAPGPQAVLELADRLVRLLSLSPSERARARAGLARMARSRFGWESVAEGIIAAAQGRLADLAVVPSDTA
ncbi:MAG: glycosyltransferase family 4 protein [Actinomycetota bacterium]|nr:glycosyltransferase family 4 protein [Actinomycetota bacterium]MDQ3719798.1 glycosyltransferase family 4 protein [Actinomycetota bacterium]